jgi:hypothetical protein
MSVQHLGHNSICPLDEIRIDGPPGRPGSGCVNFIALTAVLRREFHYTPFRAKDMKIMAVKIKRRRPNSEGIHYIGDFKERIT